MRYLFLLLVLVVSVSSAQITIETSASYATADTTSWYGISVVNPVIAAFYARDSCNVVIYCDYRGAGAPATVYSTYTVTGTDSTNSTTAAGCFKGYTLRAANLATDNIPGGATIRFRVSPLTTLNGTTSPTYKLLIYQ